MVMVQLQVLTEINRVLSTWFLRFGLRFHLSSRD